MAGSKRDHIRKSKKENSKRNQWLAIGAIVTGAIILALILILPNLQAKNNTPSLGLENIVVPDLITDVTFSQNTLGSPDAPAKLTEFADFQCPACKNFALKIKPVLIDQYIKTGRLSLTFVPYSFIDDGTQGRESKAAAEAAYCAMDQNHFWDFYNILFANQEGENVGSFSSERLLAFAEKLNLNMDDFKSCINSGKYTQKVLDDRTTAEGLGLSSTPSFSLNGTVQSFANYDQLYAAIDALAPVTK